MGITPTQSHLLKFGAFEVDLASGELRKSGMRQNLSGQPFEALRILLAHPQEIVSREALRKHLWPENTFVDYDLAVKRVMNRLREALGDSADNPRFIETIPRKGYRFIAPVTGNGAVQAIPGSPAQESAGEIPRPPRHLRVRTVLGLVAAVVLALVLVVGAKFGWRPAATSAYPQIQSLAVLPLQNLSNDPNQEYFSDGMTDGLITDLAQVGSWRVISRTSSMQYKQTKKPLPEIARELNVDGIVEGTVQRSGDQVRITAQLIEASTDRHLWARAYERDTRDLFELERDLTADIAHEVQVQLAARNHAAPALPRPVNPKVLDAYLQGNFHLHQYSRGSGDEEKKKASELFQQIIDAEPDFAPGYVGLALAHLDREQSTSEDLAITKRAAEKAVQLDPASSDVWLVFAEMKEEIFLDWPGAEADYRRSITVNPNNASAHGLFGEFLGEIGRLDDGLRECRIAEQLDPNDDHMSRILYLRREYDRSIAVLQMMLKNHPDDGYLHNTLYYDYTKKGMYTEAVQELVQAVRLFGAGKAATYIDHAFTRSGYPAAMRQLAKEIEHVHDTNQGFFPGNLALTYAALGEKDRAFYWLEQAYQHRDIVGTDIPLPFLVRDPMADPLRSDPRFKDLVHRLGLPQ